MSIDKLERASDIKLRPYMDFETIKKYDKE